MSQEPRSLSLKFSEGDRVFGHVIDEGEEIFMAEEIHTLQGDS